MKRWTFITLLLCFSFLISALPLPQPFPRHAIDPGQYTLDKRAIPDPPERVKTPTPADSPHVPALGQTGAYYDAKNKMVWAFYGDTLRQHAYHILINQHLNPVNRLPMERANVMQHQRNRRHALRNIPTKPGMARDEKPAAMFEHVDDVDPTVMMVSAKESSLEGALLSQVSALMDEHKVTRGAVRANLGFKSKSKPDMSLGISAPAKLPTSRRVDDPRKRRTRKIERQGQLAKDPYKYLADPTYKGDVHHPVTNRGIRLRARKGNLVSDPNSAVQKDKQQKKQAVRFKKNFLIHPPPLVTPGQAWRPVQGDGPTHAGAPLPHTNVEDRQPEKFKNHAHYANHQKEQEEKQAKDKLEQEHRVTQEAPEVRLASKHSGTLPVPVPRPLSPNLSERIAALRIHTSPQPGDGHNAVAGPSRHTRPDTHAGGSKTDARAPVSGAGGGKHAVLAHPAEGSQLHVPVPVRPNTSVSPPVHVPHNAPPTRHSPSAHVQEHSPPAHNTRSRKGKDKEANP